MERLPQRQEQLLDFIVREYIDTATPVSSRATVEKRDLGVSSATIRAEMARLESLGYLTHPHTSAGRMPTALGYRYFVGYLMEETALPLSDRRMIEHQFHQVDMDLEQWIRLAGAILTSRAGTASLVTSPGTHRARFGRLELVQIEESSVLLLVVLQKGSTGQRIIRLESRQIPGGLQTLADELNSLLSDLSSEDIRAKSSQWTPAQERLAEQVAELMNDLDLRHGLELHRYGFADILRQPEFAEAEQVEKVVGILEHPGHLESILSELGLSQPGVQVIIGGEERWPQMSDFSLVLARYGAAWRTEGVLGVMGPIRMPYSKNVPMVSYMADLMSRLMRGQFA